jgi:hypothetical protein
MTDPIMLVSTPLFSRFDCARINAHVLGSGTVRFRRVSAGAAPQRRSLSLAQSGRSVGRRRTAPHNPKPTLPRVSPNCRNGRRTGLTNPYCCQSGRSHGAYKM